MLDTTTKRRIDTARDILVGKVPDPKSQVEQITIALIYKFMDDMDLDAEELGGEPSFFSGEYEKYGWRKIFNPSLGGFEMLSLYSEAILKMAQNPNLPQLFRDIFKNAYLPYRDPETLKSFLKIINDFSYDHSEKLGDAFEYLLSVLGSQGDAGQFRTPRHVIDFMTALIAPKKNETVLDPACGTAGFLISAYKHILKENSTNYDKTDPYTFEQNNVKLAEITVNGKHYKGDKLSPDDRARIIQNIKGYDISPDMVRLSLVNLYLHGFTDPHIHEYDTLTSEERWNEFYDIILANPPFMSPKGGIRPHKRFAVQSKRSEVLFVDYMAEHLTPTGKAAIIVPEGIIFQSGTAYKSLRKMLVEDNYLVGVISLPAGVFNPYSGVKTSILWLDKSLAKKTDKILFAKIENDGFDLGAQRRPIKQNDLPGVFRKLTDYRDKLMLGEDVDFENEALVSLVEKEKIAENGEFSLNGERYRTTEVISSNYSFAGLGQLCEILDSKRKPITKGDRVSGEYPYYGATGILDYVNDYIFNEKLVLIGEDGAKWDAGEKTAFIASGKYWVNNHAHVLRPDRNKLLDEYLVEVLNYMNLNRFITGITVPKLNQAKLKEIEIPLPPLSVQEEIVADIESYQKIIDGARQVVENYKPKINIDPEWEMVKLGEVTENLDGKRVPITKSDRKEGEFPYYGASGIVDYVDDYLFDEDLLLVSEDGANLRARVTPIAFSVSGKVWVNNHAHVLRFEKFESQKFVEFYLNSISLDNYITGSAQPKLNQKALNSIKVPWPDFEIQKQIVTKITIELDAINANKLLLESFEQRINERIAKIWGE